MNRYLATFLAMLCASLAVSSACFAAPNEPASRAVAYGDLDLSSAHGVAALHRRVGHAINALCADPTGPSPAVTVDLACKAEAWAAAHAQLDGALAARRIDSSIGR